MGRTKGAKNLNKIGYSEHTKLHEMLGTIPTVIKPVTLAELNKMHIGGMIEICTREQAEYSYYNGHNNITQYWRNKL